MNPARKAIGKREEMQRALLIRKSLGVRTAAAYLRDRRWSIEAALWLLARAN